MARVVVVGGVVMDFILRVPAWPQPGEAVQGRFSAEPGGKGLIQSVAAARLGAETAVISAMGDDPYGKEIRDILKHERVKLHVDVQEVLGKEDGTDVTAVILPKDGRPGFIGCRRATDKLTPRFVEQAIDAIKRADVVLVTFDASIEAAQKVIELAKEAHKPIVVNPAPPMEVPLSVLDGVDYVVPNEWEAREWIRLNAPELLDSPDGPLSNEEIGYKLVEQGAKVAIITHDFDGCLVVDRQGARRYPAYRVEAIDTTGASGAFCAGLAVAFARSLERRKGPKEREQEIISFASAASAQACTKYGALHSMPSYDDVRAFLETHPLVESLPVSSDVSQLLMPAEEAATSAAADARGTVWNHYRAVIFDCDDTILATAKTRWKALIATAAQFEVELHESTIRAAWGKPFDELIATLVPAVSLETFLPAYQEVMRQFPPEPTPGAVLLLQSLEASGIRMEIVTSSRRDLIVQDLETVGLQDFFDDIWGHEQTAPYNKPDPRVLSPVLAKLVRSGVARSGVVYIGDSVRDYQVASGNEVDFIGVTSGLEDAAALRAAGIANIRIVPSLHEVARVITDANSSS